MCRLLLDRFDMKEIAMCLSKTAWEAHPESLILALDYIDDLVTNGDRDRALWVASHIAPDPEMLVSKAQEIVGEAREKVLKLLPRFGEEMQVALV